MLVLEDFFLIKLIVIDLVLFFWLFGLELFGVFVLCFFGVIYEVINFFLGLIDNFL